MSTVVVWLDANADSTTGFRDKLASYRLVQIFTKPDDCIDYIQSYLMQNIFLIVSGSLAQVVVPQVVQYTNIKRIFVFCVSIASHLHWAVEYTEQLFMFDHPDDLLERLWNEMEQNFREQAHDCIKQAEELKERAEQCKQPPCG